MSMMRKTITIPHGMENWVKAQIRNGRYANDSEYFRDLIRRDQESRLAQRDLLALVEEGINSGMSDQMVPDIMKHVEEKLKHNGELPANEQSETRN